MVILHAFDSDQIISIQANDWIVDDRNYSKHIDRPYHVYNANKSPQENT